MVSMTCPWCDEDGLVAFIELEAPEVDFSCADCGTTVSFEPEPAEVYDLAA